MHIILCGYMNLVIKYESRVHIDAACSIHLAYTDYTFCMMCFYILCTFQRVVLVWIVSDSMTNNDCARTRIFIKSNGFRIKKTFYKSLNNNNIR